MALWDEVVWASTHVAPAARSSLSAPAADASTDWLEAFVGPAVVAALITVFLGGFMQYRFTRRKDREGALLDLRLKALNEFYAPIRTLLAQNKAIHDALRSEFAATGEWHVLDHLEEIKAKPSALLLIKQILEINNRIGKVLETKSGLDLGESKHLAQWEVHRKMLAHAFAEGVEDITRELTYFPKAFESEIVSMHDALVREVKETVGIKGK